MRIFRFSLGLMSFLRPGTPATSTLGLNCLQHPASPLQVLKCEFPGYCLYHLKKLGQSGLSALYRMTNIPPSPVIHPPHRPSAYIVTDNLLFPPKASKCDFSHHFLCRLKYLGKFNFSAFY
ncbi:hypothetical protein C8F04DRAFT_1078308 [Mycena alexandri]|uniref:Secreted protein n=1 Tax=Mycena alexandri TaxID=1745969 RepID=A0AAD6T9P3_9AGAR|nr:hypothetical protein C8F04DRAFT_1148137 [Mycena alexandri]KAJ7031477.1 hypothetical protein C8F04DRAFT_1110369 [Mycena alexandri]KAJ7042104.1 hypothetical protein C8F04DRAFT_1078308 [Mycena alexandri]